MKRRNFNDMLRFVGGIDHRCNSEAKIKMESYEEVMYPNDYKFDFLRKLIQEGCENLKTEPQIIAQAIFMPLFASLQGRLYIEAPDGRLEKSNECMVLIGPSSCGKSRSSRQYLMPFRKFEAKLKEKKAKDYEDYMANRTIWNLKVKKLNKEFEKCKDPIECINLENEIKELQKCKPSEVSDVNLIFEKATPTAIASEIAKSKLSALYVDDEASGYYSGSMSRNPAVIHSLIDGASYSQISIDRGAEICENPTLNISLYIQNSPFACVRDKIGDKLKTSGSDSRTLFAYTNYLGSDTSASQTYREWRYFEEYERRVELITNRFYESKNTTIKLSIEAKNKYSEFYNTCIEQVHETKEAAHIAEYMIRSISHLLKVAGMLAILDNPEATTINESIMESAELIINYHTLVYDQILRSELYYNRKGFEEDINELYEKIDAWNSVGRIVNKSMLLQYAPNRLRNKNKLDMALRLLLAKSKIHVLYNRSIMVNHYVC